MDQKFYDLIEANPVIAAIKDMEGLSACCAREEIKVVFILFGDICNIGSIVRQIKEAGKVAMVHIDLITGLSGKEVAVDYIKIIRTPTASFPRNRSLLRGPENCLCTPRLGFLFWIPWRLKISSIRWRWLGRIS